MFLACRDATISRLLWFPTPNTWIRYNIVPEGRVKIVDDNVLLVRVFFMCDAEYYVLSLCCAARRFAASCSTAIPRGLRAPKQSLPLKL